MFVMFSGNGKAMDEASWHGATGHPLLFAFNYVLRNALIQEGKAETDS